jgi:hypothetical protein
MSENFNSDSHTNNLDSGCNGHTNNNDICSGHENVNCVGHTDNDVDCSGHNSNCDGECDCKNKDNNIRKDFYNTSVLLLSAGKLIKKYNFALGELLFSTAEIILNDLENMNKDNPNNNKSFEPKDLSPEIEEEVNNIINKLNEE